VAVYTSCTIDLSKHVFYYKIIADNAFDALEKIILFTHYFPPCNYTPSERVASWCKRFHHNGLYPIVITRFWQAAINNQADLFAADGDQIIVQKHEGYEVHYLPYKPNFRWRVFRKLHGTKLYFFSLLVSFFYQFLEPLFALQDPFTKSSQKYMRQLLHAQKDVRLMLITVSPFMYMKLGVSLKREFERLALILDYRDDWSTNKLFNTSFVRKLLHWWHGNFERAWARSYAGITSVTEEYVSRLADLHKREVFLAENGYKPIDEKRIVAEGKPILDKAKFNIVYIGSLFPMQDLTLFCSVLKQLVDDGYHEVVVTFVGAGLQHTSHAAISSKLQGYENHYIITPRVAKQDAILAQLTADVLLHVRYGSNTGLPGSKMYEYLACKKPILLCPSDGDLLQELAQGAGLWLNGNSLDDAIASLIPLIVARRNNQPAAVKPNLEFINKFDRYQLADKFAQLVLQLV
jgi:hypothetical protein